VNELVDVDRDLFGDTAINAGSFDKLSRSSMRRMRQPDQFDDHCGNAPGLLLGDAGALKARAMRGSRCSKSGAAAALLRNARTITATMRFAFLAINVGSVRALVRRVGRLLIA
jgi:hypothetical protein